MSWISIRCFKKNIQLTSPHLCGSSPAQQPITVICSVTRSYKKKRARNEAGAFLPKGLRVLVVRARP
ncbi:hypothetical protein EN766_31370, partial [Mesorhizobium sp. M2A.F.Ca.ET.046.02.1.1]